MMGFGSAIGVGRAKPDSNTLSKLQVNSREPVAVCLMSIGEKSRSLTMSAMSSTNCAHLCMHSLKSAISLW